MDPLRSERPQQDVGALMANMVNMWQVLAQHSADIAASKRTLFLAYVGEGFTESQALELVKQV
jgi:hypothetical protein